MPDVYLVLSRRPQPSIGGRTGAASSWERPRGGLPYNQMREDSEPAVLRPAVWINKLPGQDPCAGSLDESLNDLPQEPCLLSLRAGPAEGRSLHGLREEDLVPGGSPVVRRRRLGQALRELRIQAGTVVERSGPWIGRLEADKRNLKDLPTRVNNVVGGGRFADALSEAYGLQIGLAIEIARAIRQIT
jgi:hypothetical protein